jgi:hypothetical protein
MTPLLSEGLRVTYENKVQIEYRKPGHRIAQAAFPPFGTTNALL